MAAQAPPGEPLLLSQESYLRLSYLIRWAHTGDLSPLGHWRRGLAAISPCSCAAWKGPIGAGFGSPLELDRPRLMSSWEATTASSHGCIPPAKKKPPCSPLPDPFLASASPSSSSL